jgi:zinc/manganese transport system substrate-binding protein
MKKVRKQPRITGTRWAVAATLAIIIVIGVYVLMNASTRSTGSDSNAIKVVAGENFWGNIASQIGGNKVNVTSIINDPNADPHLYESDAHDAIAIAEAGVVIKNGLGYDDFMDKLLSASSNSHRQVIAVANVLNISGQDANPHLWYDIPMVPKVASEFEAAFAAKDPADEALFEQNLRQFDASLQPLTTAISNINTYYRGTPVAYTERVPGYLLQDAGLNDKTPTGFASAIEDGNDPSPADTLAMDDLIANRGVKILLYNAQTISPVTQHVRELAVAAGIPVIGVTETMPENATTYQSWQLDQINELKRALGGK